MNETPRKPAIPPNPLVALGDVVIAIAMTLLVHRLGVVAVVHAINMMLACGAGWATFTWAAHRRRLAADDLDPALVMGGIAKGFASPTFLASRSTGSLVSLTPSATRRRAPS